MPFKNKDQNKDNKMIEEKCDQLINALKELREKSQITTEQLSNMTGIKQPNITRLETGGSNPNKPQRPTLKTLVKVADALGADIKIVTRKQK